MATKKATVKRQSAQDAPLRKSDVEQAASKAQKTAGPRSTLQRVQKMREERARLGLKRLELYVHPEDWDQVKALAARLQRKREKHVEE